MKILHIFDHSLPLHSGYTFRSQAIIEQQRKQGYVTEHITSAKHAYIAKINKEEEVVDGLHFYRTLPTNNKLENIPILNQIDIIISLMKRLDKVVKIFQPDILHAHSPALNGLAALRIGKHYKIPVVYEIRAFWEDAAVDHGTTYEGSPRYKLTKIMETFVAKNANYITTICDGLRCDLVNRGISRDKITVIPNAVDIENFKSTNSKNTQIQNLLDLNGKIVIGFIGSFYAYEGIHLAIDALNSVKDVHQNIKLLLVGGGPQEDILKMKVKELQLDNNVIFTGRIPHDQVMQYYDLIDIFVYPRLPMRLTELVTPLKPLEAMAKKRLVVASDVGGHKELIRNGETGVLFKANSIDALANALIELINNKQNWSQIVNAAHKYIESERTWSKSVSNYNAIYRQLIK